MKILKNHPIQNTFGVSVKAKKFIIVEKDDDALNLLDHIKKDKFITIGEGSNVLFLNEFYDGVVINFATSEIKIFENEPDDDENYLKYINVDAGVKWIDFVNFTVNENLYGTENLANIPGTVGAAPIQNIGAYGQEVSNIITFVEGINLDTEQLDVLSNSDCKFGYRDSIFKNELKNKFIITNVGFALSSNKNLNLNYSDIQNYIAENKLDIENLTSKDIAEIITKIRNSKLPHYKQLPNAGSFFKNPVVDFNTYQYLVSFFENVPHYKINDGEFKIPAAFLIEKAGLKGYRDGNVGTHINQPLVLVNYGVETGREILYFANKIKSIIKDKFNIELHSEVNIIE